MNGTSSIKGDKRPSIDGQDEVFESNRVVNSYFGTNMNIDTVTLKCTYIQQGSHSYYINTMTNLTYSDMKQMNSI